MCNVFKKAGRWVVEKVSNNKVATGVVSGGLAAAPTFAEGEATFSIPTIVDWSQVTTAIVTYVGPAVVAISGLILGFAVVKKIIGRGTRAA